MSLVHSITLLIPHPVFLASSANNSVTVHRRAPGFSQKTFAVVQSTAPLQPSSYSLSPQTLVLPKLSALLHPRSSQLEIDGATGVTGTDVGAGEGTGRTGARVGAKVGTLVGKGIGEAVGVPVGEGTGALVGTGMGEAVGVPVGKGLGA